MKKLKYYSRKFFFILALIIVPLLVITGIILSKYKPVYSVTYKGNQIGLVSSKEEIENRINEFLTPKGRETTATLEEKPQYEIKLASKGKIQTQEKDVLQDIDKDVVRTYISYELKIDDEVIGNFYDKNIINEILTEAKKNDKFKENAKIEIIDKIVNKEETDSQQAITEKVTAKANKIVEVVKQKEAEAEKKRREEQLKYSAMVAASTGSGNLSLVNDLGIIRPTPARRVTSAYGPRSGGFHTGIDIDGDTGDAIWAAAGGTVIGAGWNGGYGKCIQIDHGNGVVTLYAHLDSISVKVGETVVKSQYIGAQGSTGWSTGSHLHFEIRLNGRQINPYPYVPGLYLQLI